MNSALKLLDFEKIPQFQYSRLIKRDLINNGLETEIWRTICNLRIQQEYYQQYDLIRDIQLMASGNSAESAMDCHRRVRGVIAEQIFDSHGCKVGKND